MPSLCILVRSTRQVYWTLSTSRSTTSSNGAMELVPAPMALMMSTLTAIRPVRITWHHSKRHGSTCGATFSIKNACRTHQSLVLHQDTPVVTLMAHSLVVRNTQQLGGMRSTAAPLIRPAKLGWRLSRPTAKCAHSHIHCGALLMDSRSPPLMTLHNGLLLC